MNYAIIGAGNVGAALARQFARHGIAVSIANTRGPDSLAPLAAELGDKVRPVTLAEAITAELLILAIPFRAHAELARLAPDWGGKIVIDAMNTYGVSPEELRGQPSSALVAAAFAGAKLVKTLNQLPARLLAADPAEPGGRRVMFLAGDDEAANASVARLVGELGFAPLVLGTIGVAGALLEKGGPLVLQNLVKLA